MHIFIGYWFLPLLLQIETLAFSGTPMYSITSKLPFQGKGERRYYNRPLASNPRGPNLIARSWHVKFRVAIHVTVESVSHDMVIFSARIWQIS